MKDANILTWSDKYRRMGVRANADQPDQAKLAYAFGARGIGLCRTEHMFFDPERIVHMREMILATTGRARRAALEKLLPYQVCYPQHYQTEQLITCSQVIMKLAKTGQVLTRKNQ